MTVRVLYLTGWLRTGSTLLGNVLNELPGVLHAGELHYLWRNGIQRTGTNSSCGCGKDLLDCPLWSAVLDACPAARTDADEIVRGQRLVRTRHVRTRLAEARGSARPAAGMGRLLDAMSAIYHAVAAAAGAELVVDGSKYPAEAAALLGRADLDVRLLHLVRDPRAIAYSYRQSKAYIDPRRPAESSRYWTGFNLASELAGRAAAGRYLRVRYEDLTARPREVTAAIMRFAGLAGEPPVDRAGLVALTGNHTVTGNPDRLVRGPARIAPDDRWRTGLSRRDVVLATVPALPLLHRYRYPLFAELFP